jgi:hypothetical protein
MWNLYLSCALVPALETPTSADVFCGALRQQCTAAQKSTHSLAGYRVCVCVCVCERERSEGYLDTVE